ncbi:MAG TPA: M20 family metallopeptidase [Thermomicrobiales bacterium]|nr:M20 family metallopeptidase [Thermomicrobiales bacterium]
MAVDTRTEIGVLRERVKEAIANEREHLVEVAETIRTNPELGYEERMASQLLADQLREAGFEVEKPYKGIETAFRATRKGGAGDGPTVAILAEYDALAGIGHGCGHNLIGGSGLATAIGLGAVIDEVGGTVVIMGTPAEEGGAGKIRIAEQGGFDDIDAALMIHHAGDKTGAPVQWPQGTCLAVTDIAFEFFGQPSHAAADPENGVNALNAVIETFNGINALRQHVVMDARIHGIITHGGEASNVTPKYARAAFLVRAATQSYVAELTEKVRNIARGAALMTGTELKIEEGTLHADMRPSYVLGERYRVNMEDVGLDLSQGREGRGMHSTDFGDISYRLPSVTGSFAISTTPIPGHSQQVVDASGSEFGYDQYIKVSTAMALTALDILTDPDLSKQAWEKHKRWSAEYEG